MSDSLLVSYVEAFFLATAGASFIHYEHGYNHCQQYPVKPVVVQATPPPIYHGILIWHIHELAYYKFY